MSYKKERGEAAAAALKNLAKAGAGGAGAFAGVLVSPLVGLVVTILGQTIVDLVSAKFATDKGLSLRGLEVARKHHARDLQDLKAIFREVAGLASEDEAKSELENLAEAVEDPDGLQEHAVFREAMLAVFDRVHLVTEDITQLALGLSEQSQKQSAQLNRIEKTADSILERLGGTGGTEPVTATPSEVSGKPDPAVPRAPTDGHFHSDIDAAAELIKAMRPDLAIYKLEEIKRRAGGSLTPRERFRVTANFGHAAYQQGDYAKASEFFIEAAVHQPGDPDAQALLAYGHLLKGD
jgi:hypothetical protein